MPFGDGTGPGGMGPMTGRGAGYCVGYPTPGYMNPGPGRGFGRGMGRGMGWGRGRGGQGWGRGFGRQGAYPYVHPGMQPYGANPYMPEPTPKEELGMLRSEAEAMNQQMKDIQERIKTLEKTEAKEQN